MAAYTIGLDFGSDSARAIVVDCATGAEVVSAVAAYPRWSRGEFCSPTEEQFRQHPQDYIDVMQCIVHEVIEQLPAGAQQSIVGIGIDTTGSTPIAVDENGVALALRNDFSDNPNAMFILWKDHTAVQEAEEINALANSDDFIQYTAYCGGLYSSEWFWSKVLHTLRKDSAVAAAAHTWVEHCDWLPAVLSNNKEPSTWKRSRCAAGHKALWHESWDGLPSEKFLTALDPRLAGLRERLFNDTYTSDQVAGHMSLEWSEKLGLPVGIPIAVGGFDAHFGAIGSGAGPQTLVKVMGTSTCDMLVAEVEQALVPGICGQVDGSIMPGAIGFEAGQSAFGDVFAWYRNQLSWALGDALDQAENEESIENIIPALSRAAELIPIGSHGVSALDWFNGRRSPDVDARARGALVGMTIGSDAPTIFRALVESVACGARAINQRFVDNGIEIKDVVALGGVAKKSPLVMQICADMMQRSIGVVESEQCCALGAAIFAAVAAKVHPNVHAAQAVMASSVETIYTANAAVAEEYNAVYERYQRLGALLEPLTEVIGNQSNDADKELQNVSA